MIEAVDAARVCDLAGGSRRGRGYRSPPGGTPAGLELGVLLACPGCVLVLVMTAGEVERVAGAARLVPPRWRRVEPLVHAPEAVQAARVRRVRVVDDSVLERERAHARAFARVGGP